jgi:uncharacterized membrane protein
MPFNRLSSVFKLICPFLIQELTGNNISDFPLPVAASTLLIDFLPGALWQTLFLGVTFVFAMNRKKITLLLRAGAFFLTAIGIAMVIRRTLAMAGIIAAVNPSGAVPFDTGFAQHPLLTFMHILPGMLFMLLGPWQFMPGIRERYLSIHRISGRIYIVCGYIVGLSALSMPFIMLPIGGMNEAAASILFSIFFLVSLSKAWWHIMHKNVSLHREWMIRAFAIGLAVSTVRPIIGLFFGFSGLAPQVFFGTAFWIGFTLHAIVAEVWIDYTRRV